MRPGTLVRLALAGSRTDTVRVALTALSAALATLAVLSAATVLAIRPAADGGPRCGAVDPAGVVDCAGGYALQYASPLLVEPGLRPGVAFTLLLLCIPVLALAGQSARLGAPARDRRLAAIRLAGAGPRQVVAVAVVESGLAALAGAGLGTAVYLAGRALLHRPDASGNLPLPTDQLPPLWTFAAIVGGLPLLAALAAVLLLRRVALTPFGVVRRHRDRPPRAWPGVLIVLGVGGFAAIAPLASYYAGTGRDMPPWLLPALVGGGGLLAMLGVVLGTAWISYRAGRLLHRFARRPAALLAARRLQADPWTGSRVFAALLACVMVGAGAAGVRAWFAAMFAVERDNDRAITEARGRPYRGSEQDYSFYFRTLDLVDAAVTVAMVVAGLGLLVFLVEGIVSRRRAYSALAATGVPRRALARTLSWQVLAPVVPAVVLALAVGVTLPRSISREVRSGGYRQEVCTAGWEQCEQPDSPYLRTVEIPEFVRPVAIPYQELAVVGGVALAAVLATLGVALLFLRPSTDVSELRST